MKTMRIKFHNLTPRGNVKDAVDEAVARVMASGQFILGQEVERFEEQWAGYVGAKYCVSCGNGFDAIQLILRGIGVDGHPIGVSEKTCLPTWAAICAAGGIPMPLTYSESLISVVVHLYGNAELPSAGVIQDACQAHGSRYNGTDLIVGSIGTCAWSFYPTKNLGALGDAGAVTTDSRDIYQQALSLRAYGTDEPGINSRMDELQAAILSAKLPFLDEENDMRRLNAGMYNETIGWNSVVSQYQYGNGANYHQYVVYAKNRDEFRDFLGQNGIETAIHYSPPPYRHPAMAAIAKRAGSTLWNLHEVESWANTCVSLPIASHLSDGDIGYVADTINKYLEFAK